MDCCGLNLPYDWPVAGRCRHSGYAARGHLQSGRIRYPGDYYVRVYKLEIGFEVPRFRKHYVVVTRNARRSLEDPAST